MTNKIELKNMTELGRLFVVFFRAHVDDEEVDRDDVQAAYDLIEVLAGKDALNSLKEHHEKMDFGNYRELPYE